jgi:hypothetical protein
VAGGSDLNVVVEMLHEPVESEAVMGSFDYVRLAPHSAQDDSVFGLDDSVLGDSVFGLRVLLRAES